MKRVLLAGMLGLLALTGTDGGPRPASCPLPPRPLSVIVQGPSAARAADAVRWAGGTIRSELGIVKGVEAELTGAQITWLRRAGGISVFPNVGLRTAGQSSPFIPESAQPVMVHADALQGQGTRGEGVTVALIDTGLGTSADLQSDGTGNGRILAGYDALQVDNRGVADLHGHGSHVASVLGGSRLSHNEKFLGVAPNVRLVVVKAFGEDGAGTYASVIRGLDWVVQNRAQHNIKVLNLAFSAPPRSHYWQDPLAQAVMRAWQAGITVVVAAGNGGFGPQTIGVPGNVPYVITVGAMTDRATPLLPQDDRLASFSAAGPTYEGFIKPDLVAPGGHVLGTVQPSATLAQEHPESRGAGDLFTMSGTSQSAAVVSGTVALMLQRQPDLTPDQVKCRLMATAHPAVDGDPTAPSHAYSVFQEGAGLVDAEAAAASNATNCANRGLDVAADLAGTAHYGGRGNRDSAGNFVVTGRTGDGFTWNGKFEAGHGHTFLGYPWGDQAALWSEALPWVEGSYNWDGYPWPDGPVVFTLGESVTINRWVPQE
jgi:serine protease AprX